MIRIVVLMFTAFILLFSSCGPPVARIGFGQEFSLHIGQSATIAGDNLEITFDSVIEDSRCATGATCVWEGRVKSIVEITDGDSTNKIILTQLGLTDLYAEQDYGIYKIAFTVNPYPELEQEIAEDEYRLVMVISK
ncbi:MAG: hypothetical protein KAI14_00105 [Dehalococcoidales bacterium]|nr:hypothetical protein [Dehalococcoidales bacterium]